MAEEVELEIVVMKDRIMIEQSHSKDVGVVTVVRETDEQVLTGTVLKIGALVEDVAVDNQVLYEKHSALPIRYLGKDYLILRESDVIAII